MKTELLQYAASRHYLSAIINDDYSGLNDEECKEVKDFLIQTNKDMENNGCNNGHWAVNDDMESNFELCDISGLLADCYYLDFVIYNEDKIRNTNLDCGTNLQARV